MSVNHEEKWSSYQQEYVTALVAAKHVDRDAIDAMRELREKALCDALKRGDWQGTMLYTAELTLFHSWATRI